MYTFDNKCFRKYFLMKINNFNKIIRDADIKYRLGNIYYFDDKSPAIIKLYWLSLNKIRHLNKVLNEII